jgi:hypothetical protein
MARRQALPQIKNILVLTYFPGERKSTRFRDASSISSGVSRTVALILKAPLMLPTDVTATAV